MEGSFGLVFKIIFGLETGKPTLTNKVILPSNLGGTG